MVLLADMASVTKAGVLGWLRVTGCQGKIDLTAYPRE